jgi:hypothetical protein
MRYLIRAFTAASGFAAAIGAPAAMAQDYLGSFLQSQQDANIREIQQEGRKTSQDRGHAPDRATRTSRHRHACAQRYRTYDPRTDSYVARSGLRMRCRL